MQNNQNSVGKRKRTSNASLSEEGQDKRRKKHRHANYKPKNNESSPSLQQINHDTKTVLPECKPPTKQTWYSRQSEEKKNQIRERNRESYHKRKKRKISETPVEIGEPINVHSNSLNIRRGKEPLTYHSSFEIGSTSTPKRRPSLVPTPQTPHTASILPDVKPCKYCAAIRFYHEPKYFCCGDGEISLISNNVPDQLYDLYTSTSEQSSTFHKYVRTYNNTFAFTSFGVKYDKSLCKRNKGIYTFRIQGQVYHYINELLPQDNNPKYLQLYFYDTEHEIENRMKISEKLDHNIIDKLIQILHVNPYSRFFRSLGNIPNLETHKVIIRSDPILNQRVFNAPTTSQVAAMWIENENGTSTEIKERDIIVYSHAGYSHRVKYYYGCYDPLQYPLLFPYGDVGWHEGIAKINRTKGEIMCADSLLDDPTTAETVEDIIKKEERAITKSRKIRKTVSCREYYSYKLQIRPHEKSIILHTGRLLQQYVVDMYVKLETSRLDYFRQRQDEIRAEVYKGIIDSIAVGEYRATKIGKRIILPASFIGGPRDMRKRYLDAMTLVQRFGKPDIFLTMTCNPNWIEIKRELKFGEQAQDRPDLVARIFRAKIEQLKDELFKKHFFGEVSAYVYVIEFQKRGLPHAHFLIILQKPYKLTSPEQYDNIVCAELPDKDTNPHLYATVVKHMMHGPCGPLNRQNVCMKKDGHCKNQFPKEFCSTTKHGENSFPLYRRRDNGAHVQVRGATLDNRWVVPYNPYLLAIFDCHMNVEICSTISAIKYLYKYVYKGHDRIAFHIITQQTTNDINEIDQFQSARWISAPEAMWRVYKFPLYEIHPPVINLQLHLEDMQLISFRKHNNLKDVINNEFSAKTTLTEYFSMNKTNINARQYLYKKFPEHFVWDKKTKTWNPRTQRQVIGRSVTANPIEGERYYLRLLLNHIKGATSFTDLKIVNNKIASSYQEAALLHGLLESDKYIEDCLEEASTYQMPYTLRVLFATLLAYCNPNNPKLLWQRFEHHMSEDYEKQRNISPQSIQLKVLQSINSILESMGKDINNYCLTNDTLSLHEEHKTSKEFDDESNIQVSEEDILSISTLNLEQKHAYDTILSRIYSNKPGAFFIDGPGGTGKTYLYTALLAKLRSEGYIALATATSDVAASNMPVARTAHSRFKLPLDVDDNATCNISKQSSTANLLRVAKLIIWDEASMAKRQAIEAVNEMLKDIMECDLPFGGKVIVLGGDFRQVLPVAPKKRKDEQIDASLVRSDIWPALEKIKLTENMRAQFDHAFCQFLMRIGNGTEPEIHNNNIKFPSSMVIPYTNDTTSLQYLINDIFPNLEMLSQNPDIMIRYAILTPKNQYVDAINDILINKFPGNMITYHSFDKTTDPMQQENHEDFLNNLTLSGLPPHTLTLKANCHVILLRNIDPSKGLCNGTRLICRRFQNNVIDAEIAVGYHRGRRVFIPRIPLQPSKSDHFPISFKRTQFPIRLCFAMSINKAQGQTLERVGIYLPQPVFSHGQLYVAISRAKTATSVKLLIKPYSDDIPENYTKNIVYREILAAAECN